MPDSRLVIPHDIEGVLVDVLQRRHQEHLAKAERQRGEAPGTYERFATIVRMSDAGAARLSGDTVPACLLGIIGAPTFRRNAQNAIDAVYQLGMEVTVMGNRRRDTLLRRDVMAWTVAECVYQRVPRRTDSDDLVASVHLVDYEPLAEENTQRTVGVARFIWEVGVTDVLSITGGLPTDDSDWPPEAGGAPTNPLDPIRPLPVATATFRVDKRPIVE